MSRYVAADDFLDLFYVASAGQDKAFIETVEMVVADTPTADVAPVVHGKWESVYTTYWKWKPDGAHPVDRIIYRCSECNRRTAIKTSYCPNCGAKMDLWRFEE